MVGLHCPTGELCSSDQFSLRSKISSCLEISCCVYQLKGVSLTRYAAVPFLLDVFHFHFHFHFVGVMQYVMRYAIIIKCV